MRSSLLTGFAALVLFLGGFNPAVAQIVPPPAATDTLNKYENPDGVSVPGRTKWYKSKLFRATIIPAALIGYGAWTASGGGFYTDQDARYDVRKQFPNYRTRVDDFLLVVPYLELGAVALAGVESRNDRINTLLIILKGEAIMLGSTFLVKYVTRRERPDGSDRLSFPSGHTAQAFLAASIVHTEFRDKSRWYGVGSYAVAGSVAAFRMINDKHWQSDVVAGAGFGILSAHLAYLSHRNRWGRKPIGRGIGMAPAYFSNGASGLTLTWRAK
ncbi:phosphatase PAP2 family protein [Hymenobacter arizonensis]|uniref:PAP2 superfamily protein n=1 Tax=Hymenobacter arizonensis TaxID=1227077 RepID=A0A1I5STT6_HYMAR|nr:phosphatase PAP2 family protein [Hymenobacter arizonensis]SFP74214.1 PAP2 superfamily protein [Hymenobacter arizonensis]